MLVYHQGQRSASTAIIARRCLSEPQKSSFLSWTPLSVMHANMGMVRVNAIYIYPKTTNITDRLTLKTTLELEIEEAFSGTNIHAKTE